MYERAAASSLPSPNDLLACVQAMGECGRDTKITPFAEGTNNFVDLVSNGPPPFGTFVIRYPKNPADEGALRKVIRASELVGGHAPQILYHGQLACGRTVIAEEFVPGESKDFNELNESEVRALATTVSEVHATTSDRFSSRSGEAPSCCGGTYEDYLWAMVYESVHVRLGHFDISPYPEAIELLGRGLRRLPELINDRANEFRIPNRPYSKQHHDINAQNALWRPDGMPILIDWNVTFGDPADELAYIFTDNRCKPSFVETFSQNYRPPAGGGDVIARIPVYVLKNMLDDLAWTIEKRELHPNEEQWAIAYQQRLTNLSSYL